MKTVGLRSNKHNETSLTPPRRWSQCSAGGVYSIIMFAAVANDRVPSSFGDCNRWKKINEDDILFSESVAFSIDRRTPRQGHLPCTVQRSSDRSTAAAAALMIIFLFRYTFIVLYHAHLDPRSSFRT